MDVSLRINSTNAVNNSYDTTKTSTKQTNTVNETPSQNTVNNNDSVTISMKTNQQNQAPTATYNSAGKLNASENATTPTAASAPTKYDEAIKASDARWERANSNNYKNTETTKTNSDTTKNTNQGITINISVGSNAETSAADGAKTAKQEEQKMNLEQVKKAQESFKMMQDMFKQNMNSNMVNYLG